MRAASHHSSSRPLRHQSHALDETSSPAHAATDGSFAPPPLSLLDRLHALDASPGMLTEALAAHADGQGGSHGGVGGFFTRPMSADAQLCQRLLRLSHEVRIAAAWSGATLLPRAGAPCASRLKSELNPPRELLELAWGWG